MTSTTLVAEQLAALLVGLTPRDYRSASLSWRDDADRILTVTVTMTITSADAVEAEL
jgi:hypothetical protein